VGYIKIGGLPVRSVLIDTVHKKSNYLLFTFGGKQVKINNINVKNSSTTQVSMVKSLTLYLELGREDLLIQQNELTK